MQYYRVKAEIIHMKTTRDNRIEDYEMRFKTKHVKQRVKALGNKNRWEITYLLYIILLDETCYEIVVALEYGHLCTHTLFHFLWKSVSLSYERRVHCVLMNELPNLQIMLNVWSSCCSQSIPTDKQCILCFSSYFITIF